MAKFATRSLALTALVIAAIVGCGVANAQGGNPANLAGTEWKCQITPTLSWTCRFYKEGTLDWVINDKDLDTLIFSGKWSQDGNKVKLTINLKLGVSDYFPAYF